MNPKIGKTKTAGVAPMLSSCCVDGLSKIEPSGSAHKKTNYPLARNKKSNSFTSDYFVSADGFRRLMCKQTLILVKY